MKKPLLIIFLLSLSLLSFSQRSTPYPIILVHGWTGSDSNWGRTLEALKNNNLKVSISNSRGENLNEVGAGSESRLDFDLNADGDRSRSNISNDVFYYNNYLDGNNDVFVVNFYDRYSSYSNQSAAVKQGNAIGIAVQKVLNVTGADKVILFGHSMGGLAIREYLQNPQHWKFSNHKVAKFITTGTPHRGSLLGSQGLNLSGKDEKTDAVRDLRTSYYTGYNGVYLFGGYESKSYMDVLFGDYYNLDVNCNGYVGDRIVGLNQKGIDASPEFVSVIGTWFGAGTDNVVLSSSANMNKIGYGTLGKEFYTDVTESETNITNSIFSISWHQSLPRQSRVNLMALDEPSQIGKEYEIKLGKNYSGLFQEQSNGQYYDVDAYTFAVPQKGKLSVNFFSNTSNAQIALENYNGGTISSSTSQIIYEVQSSGTYRVVIGGNAKTNKSNPLNSYFFSTTFCSYLNAPSITSSNATTFCEGNSTTLSVPSGFETYQWYKDGVKVGTNSTQLQVSQVGTYTLDAYKCGNTNTTSNSVKITVNPNPAKPDLQIEEKPLLFTLKTTSTESINWLLNGTVISRATTKNYVPQRGGIYSVLASKGNCLSQSDLITIPDAPTITALTNTTFCDGDSLRIKANINVDTYRWYRDSTKLTNVKSELVVKQTGMYRAVLQSGKGVSIPSVAVAVKTKPTPVKPLIVNDIKPEQFTLTSSSAVSNQWYFNNVAINSANQQNHVPEQVGNYVVRVTNDGCFSNSDVVRIFIDKPMIELTSKNPACDSLLLRTQKGFGAYHWNIGGQIFNTLSNEIVVKKSGNISLNVVRGKISSPQSDIVGIVVNPTPTKPTITLTDDLEIPSLESSYLLGNQWYLSGTIIDKATDQFLRNLIYGEYKVSTTQLGCSNISEPFKIALLDDFTFTEKTKVYPNPSSGEFKIEVPFSNITNISIYGINGIEYANSVVNSFNRGKEMSVSLPSGAYLIKIVADGKEVVKKFMINR